MKKILALLATIIIPAYVLAQTTVGIFIDQANSSIISKDGASLKVGSAGTQGVNVLVDGVSEMTVSATAVTLPTNSLTVTAGNVAATAGSVSAGTTLAAGTTVTAGTGVTATTGNVVATAGAVNAGTTMTAGTGITATAGGVTATAGNITATAGNLVLTAGEIVMAGISTKAAAGSTNADAVALTTPVTYVTGADDSVGVILAAGSIGSVRWIYNTVGNKVLKIYPPALDAVNGQTTTTGATSCPAGALCVCTKVAALTWYCGL